MTMICPRDGSACPDDLCRGSGCMSMGGYEMLTLCDACGGLIDHEIGDLSTCTCDDQDGYYGGDPNEGEEGEK